MQTYPLKLAPTSAAIPINAEGDLFVYESGDAGGGDTRICVKPDNGAEIILKPGQRFRIKGEAQRWNVSLKDPAATLSAAIVIGSGEFDDANTLNKFTLDASFANNVTVNNTTANRVPVALDPNALLNSSAPVMAYTHTKNYFLVNATTFNTAIVTAAENVNGIIIEQVRTINNSIQLSAKATAPTTYNEPNATYLCSVAPGPEARTRIKVPAGQAVWALNSSATTVYVDLAYTVL